MLGSLFLFLFFSTIEGLAVFSLALYTFRINPRKYLGHLLLITVLVASQNYVTRDILSLSAIAPIVNILITMLFLATIIRIPLFWSTLMTLTGFIGFALLQSLLIYVSFGYLSIEQISEHAYKGYLLQSLSSIGAILISWALYRKGYGFTFEFDRLRFKWERNLIIVLITAFIIALVAMMTFISILVNLMVFVISLIIFLVYYIRKEREELR